MAANEKTWEHWLERLYNLRREKRGSHERPHKPVLLLSIIDLMDRGIIGSNAVPFTDDLINTFKRYFEVVRSKNDRPTIENPFYFLAGDKVWQLFGRNQNEPLYQVGQAGSAQSPGQLRAKGVVGRFDDGLWEILNDPMTRHQMREALIGRYFPEQRSQLAALLIQQQDKNAPQELREKPPPIPARDAAFRKIILEVYDYRCAACGIRVLLDHVESLVEAAHLIPFGQSRNDNPTNGMALCPNHHWAMDRFLIAPCPDKERRAGVWRVSEDRLDDRIEGQRDLVGLGGKSVIPPSEKKFFPALESLRWREKHLTATY